MVQDTFFNDPQLPFAEVRYSQESHRQFKLHMHKKCSIGAVDQGTVEYSVGDQEETLSAGSLALINPETLHSCNTVSKEQRSFFMLYLDLGWCASVQRSLWKIENFCEFSTVKIEDSEIYKRYCSTMKILMDPAIHLLEKEQMLLDVVISVFLCACEPQMSEDVSSYDISLLKQILSTDLQEDFALNSIAEKLGANPYTLLRRFKSETGITPHAYRMNCRIEQARKYLQEGMEIVEVALNCGFFDQSHLNRCFKAMTTVTPYQYRVNFIQ